MPRYFFHQVTRAGTVHDLEGTDLPDLEHARLDAVRDARHLMSDSIRCGRDISSRLIQICDEAGKVQLILRFLDAVTPGD